jgi:hypothetical protein
MFVDADLGHSWTSKDTRVELTVIARKARKPIVKLRRLRKQKSILSKQQKHTVPLTTTCVITCLVFWPSPSLSYLISSQHKSKSKTPCSRTTTRSSTTTAQKRSFPLQRLLWTKSYAFGMMSSSLHSAKWNQSRLLRMAKLPGLP